MKIIETHEGSRKVRVNIIVYKDIWNMMTSHVKPGERSKYISQLIEDDLVKRSMKKGLDHIKELRLKKPLKATTEEILTLKNYGRK